ncbi:ABSCISIC ACID-INSENSITIVE 5-like protein 1 [Morus notabilis]|nr:ABSCISIC ACID-INSENSITIVE 5-like protein 1 [Morus notabilis]
MADHQQHLLPEQAEPSKEQTMLPSLNKQNSIFSLTFDEIQGKSGRSFGSMNMEEFIANIWSVEENQVSPQQTNNQEQVLNNDKKLSAQPSNNNNSTNKSTLSRQGSFSIPIPLCKKTVDEIWFEIHKDESSEPEPEKADDSGPQRQQTLGEMTLEDFLVKAGVVQESPSEGSSQNKTVTFLVEDQSAGKAENGILDSCSGFSTRQSVDQNHFLGNGTCSGFAAYQVHGQSGVLVGQQVCNNVNSGASTSVGEKGNGLTETGGTKTGKKRIIDGPPEVVVERRQRRMIKNRESAARSRARKQAYTVELEVELNQLKEENEKLKQIMAEIELKRKREVLMKRKQCSTKAQNMAEKLRTIRRAASVAW